MKLFGQLVRTVVNVLTLPVAVAKDVVFAIDPDHRSETLNTLKRIKDEASDDY